MANITAAAGEKVYSVSRWAGLNEHPDGDTGLKIGEASRMVNWRITRDGNLKRRPGLRMVTGLCENYTAEVSENIEPLRDYETDTETVIVYPRASPAENPGSLTLTGNGGSVADGVWSVGGVTVSGGQLAENETDFLAVENGVLGVSGAMDETEYSVAELREVLEERGPGNWLYVLVDEGVYAIDSGSLDSNPDGGWRLSGYRVRAVPGSPEPVAGLWAGWAGGRNVLLAAGGGKLWEVADSGDGYSQRIFLGDLETDLGVHCIPFGGNVYILNGHDYYVYDGTAVNTVTGYTPLTAVSVGPMEGAVIASPGQTQEPVNLLTPERRVWLSPDGEGKSFPLALGVQNIVRATDLTTGDVIPSSDYSFATVVGPDLRPVCQVIIFGTAPDRSVNTIEVVFRMATHSQDASIPDYRKQVTDMRYAEIYSGTTDTRLFFYGDGTNRALYSGMDYDGQPRADYFPDQYEVAVGDSNTPITAMVRHYSTLIAYKTGECWSLEHGVIQLETEDLTPAIYCTPVNRDKGNLAMGQVRLVDNSPVTVSGTEIYHWINGSYYSSNLSRDERQARSVSGRVQKSVREMDLENCVMWDDNDGKEFYLVSGGKALVWNYVQDAWYRYEDFPAVRMANFRGEVYIGTPEGAVMRLTDSAMTDDGDAVRAEWESGAMDFGASHMRKYSSMMWVGLKPEEGTSVDVCVETDRKDTFREKIVSSEKAKVAGEPFAVRTKIKAKKFVYYRLLLRVTERMPAVTVTGVDFRVRQTGYAK